MKNLKDTKGITLIALVITIIILLILAGISIGALSGDNGLIKEAKQGKEQAEAKGERDLLGIAIVSAMQKDTYGKLTKENLDTELDKEPGSGKYESEQLGDEIQVTFIDSGRSYLVDSKGDIVSQ